MSPSPPLLCVQAETTPLASHLANEASHRIANHLAMLAALMRLQANDVARSHIAMSAKDVQRLMEEFAGRLETVAEVHRLLAYQSGGAPLDIADYLKTVAQGLVSSLTADGRTSIQCLFPVRLTLPAEQAAALGLLVGELVTNAVKYAHPAGVAGVITIAASKYDDDTIVIEVGDDGVGLPDDIDPLESQSFGLRTVRLLAMRLGASISFHNHGLGLSCAVHIPYPGRALKAVS